MPARPDANSGKVAGSGISGIGGVTAASPEIPKLLIGVDAPGMSTTDVNGLSAVNVDSPGPMPFPMLADAMTPSLPVAVNRGRFGLPVKWVVKVRSVNVNPTGLIVRLVGVLVATGVTVPSTPPAIVTGCEEEKSTIAPDDVVRAVQDVVGPGVSGRTIGMAVGSVSFVIVAACAMGALQTRVTVAAAKAAKVTELALLYIMFGLLGHGALTRPT